MLKFLINSILSFFNYKILKSISFNNSNFILLNIKTNQIVKIKFNKHSKFLARNEYDGYGWYLKNRKRVKNLKLINFFYFFGIQIEKINGKKVNYFSNFSNNQFYIKKFINFYSIIWNPKKKLLPAHGDLTFDNIIFCRNDIEIIDWEFFKKKGEVYCYDLVYFFLSTIVLPSLLNNKIKNDEKKIKKVWKKIKKKIIDKNLKKKPINFIINKFEKDSHWNKFNKIFPKKFFLNKLSQNQLEYLKKILHT